MFGVTPPPLREPLLVLLVLS